MAGKRIDAIAYLRTSSAANVGTDKDSDKRQRAAIASFAKTHGYRIVDEFYDSAVSGADPVAERPGFKAMLDRIAGNGVRVILVESPEGLRGSGNKVYFRRADNRRVAGHGAIGGWDQLRARLVGDKEGRAMIVTFSTCADSIRTVPFLQHDPDRPEDVMTDSEDHAEHRQPSKIARTVQNGTRAR
jgi:hypothetical protein